MNAMTLPLLDELLAAYRAAAADDAVRAVVLQSSSPKIFCAGLDLKLLREEGAKGVRALLQRLYLDMLDVQHTMGKPTIAAVSGAARGGGMTLSITCNCIVADETASFGYPELDNGLIPAIHFVHLPRQIGRHRAFELLFSGRSFDAAEAERIGLVVKVAKGAGAQSQSSLGLVVFGGLLVATFLSTLISSTLFKIAMWKQRPSHCDLPVCTYYL